MQIDIPLSDEDRERLEHALRPGADPEAVAKLLALAGASELLALATGRVVPQTLAEARAFRIYSLLQQGLELSEVETLTAAIFKVPMASAKRMVSAAVARYAVELQTPLGASIEKTLDDAEWDEENKRWEIRISSSFLRERILGAADPLPLPDPTRAGGSMWRFSDETYQAVRASFGLDSRPKM
jgi:hypothetical protein